jgi:hypothetical protein
MRIAAVEAVGVDERNPLQFFVRGKAPAVTWSLECRSASDAAAWVAAIQYTNFPLLNGRVALRVACRRWLRMMKSGC